jgi:hypothetical protein
MLAAEPVDDLTAEGLSLTQELLDLSLGHDANAVVVASISQGTARIEVDGGVADIVAHKLRQCLSRHGVVATLSRDPEA